MSKNPFQKAIDLFVRPKAPVSSHLASQYTTPRRPASKSRFVVSDELQKGFKSVPYSQYVRDFINEEGNYGSLYNDEQLQTAYRTSVYLFAALRRVASLMSEIKIVGEKRVNGSWERLEESHHLNRIFSAAGAPFLFQLYMNYALFGTALAYKHKTRKAIYQNKRGEPIHTYLDEAISGIHIIPNMQWEIRTDDYHNEILGFDLYEPDPNVGDDARQLERHEVVYFHDFDPRDPNDGVSMVSLALNDATTNAAIARWASHYFMSGAMPLLLLNFEDGDGSMTEADALKYKNWIQRTWQGLFGDFSLRAVLTDRKMNVQTAGIEADKVQAPELDRATLNRIASVFQIAPDLIVPPEGGSDNARHKHLMMAAYKDAVLPVAKQLLVPLNQDFGFDEDCELRLVIAEDEIKALQADRDAESTTEINIFNSGAMRYSELQEKLDAERIDPLKDFIMVNGRFQSIARVVRDDQLPSVDILQYTPQAFDSGFLTFAEVRKMMFNLPTNEDFAHRYKWQIPELNGGAGGDPTLPPPTGGDAPMLGDGGPPDNPPPTAGPGTDGDKKPEGTEGGASDSEAKQNPSEQETDADKSGPDNDSIFANRQTENRQPDAFEDKPAPPTQTLNASTVHYLTKEGGSVSPTQTSMSDVPLAEPATAIVDEVKAPKQSAYIALALPHDMLIDTVRARLMEMMAGYEVDWTDPNRYHLTLAYAPQIDDAQMLAVAQLLPGNLQAVSPNAVDFALFHLQVDGLCLFDTPDGICIALAVERDNRLDGLQSAVSASLAAQQVALSEYSRSEAWRPHITLGYAPAGTPVPDVLASVVVRPVALTFSREWPDEDPATVEIALPESEGGEEGEMVQHRLETIQEHRQRIVDALSLMMSDANYQADLPVAVQQCIDECFSRNAGGRDMILAATIQCCERGSFDADTVLLENPVLHIIRNSRKALQVTAADELKAWERKATQGGVKSATRFETRLLPLAIDGAVRTGLMSAGDKLALREVFANARKALEEATSVPDTDEDALTGWADRLAELDDDMKALIKTEDDFDEPTDE